MAGEKDTRIDKELEVTRESFFNPDVFQLFVHNDKRETIYLATFPNEAFLPVVVPS